MRNGRRAQGATMRQLAEQPVATSSHAVAFARKGLALDSSGSACAIATKELPPTTRSASLLSRERGDAGGGTASVGATIAFLRSGRLDWPRAGDAYGDDSLAALGASG